jgi:imidazolonepropionase
MSAHVPFDLVVRGTSQVVTCDGPRPSGPQGTLPHVPRGAVGVVGGQVAFLGPESQLPQERLAPSTKVLDAGGGFVGPGFVDAHTHLVFAGARDDEFALRCRGASYLEIAQAGGGIASTVKATREASLDDLVALAGPRLSRLLSQGVTCAEVKSGYGLDLDTEVKMLEAVRRLGQRQPIELVPTLLCAHAIPPEHKANRAAYLEVCREEILPAVASRGLAVFCDAFVEEGAFTAEEARSLLTAAAKAGLTPRLHADQLSSGGGAELAAELSASSADHLEQVSAAGIAALARAGVVALLVPVSTFYLRLPKYAPGRALWDAGVEIALASNVNPGSAMSENLALTLSLACLACGLSPEEAYWAATRGGARALRRDDLGRLFVGGPADLVVFGCSTPRHLPYHLGISHADVVVKAGAVAYQAPGATALRCI